jgi:FkbM family methyltransferase
MNRNAIYKAYAAVFCRKRFLPWNRMLFHMSLQGMGLLNHETMIASGEHHFLHSYLPRFQSPVIFDVGMNEGIYSEAVLAVAPNATIFAFEPNPKTFHRACARMNEHTNVAVINAACGKTAGRMTLYDYEGSEGTGHASLHPGVIELIHHHKSTQQEVDVVKLDGFADKYDIKYIDLLKVDTEGHESQVLAGAQRLIVENRVGAVHFEFNEMNIVSRSFCKDFVDLLPGFRFYRMLRDGLAPMGEYIPLWWELFAFQNIVALAPQTKLEY